MKNLFKFKNTLIFTLGVLLCLSGFIGCSSTDFPSNNSGQTEQNLTSNKVVMLLLTLFHHTLVKTTLF